MTDVNYFKELEFCLRDHGYGGLNLVNFLYDHDQVSISREKRLDDVRMFLKTHPELVVKTTVCFKLIDPVIYVDETSKYAKSLFLLDMLTNVEPWEQYWLLIERDVFSYSEGLDREIVSYLETINIASSDVEDDDDSMVVLYNSSAEFIKHHSLLLSHPSSEKACRRLIKQTETYIKNCIWFSYNASFIKDSRVLLSYFQSMLTYRESCKKSNVLKLEKVIKNVLSNSSLDPYIDPYIDLYLGTQVVDNLVFFKGILKSYL